MIRIKRVPETQLAAADTEGEGHAVTLPAQTIITVDQRSHDDFVAVLREARYGTMRKRVGKQNFDAEAITELKRVEETAATVLSLLALLALTDEEEVSS
jgi:hypothetical protein